MNRLINIILSGLLWRRYKFLIVSLVILIVLIILTGKIHEDYINFAKQAEYQTFLGWSFLIKWAVWILLVVCFFIANNIYNAKKERQQIMDENPQSVFSKLLNKKRLPKTRDSELEPQASGEDPFDHLRKKEKLRSYAEMIIDKHEKDE